MLNSKVVPLKAVIPVGNTWHNAKPHQTKHVQHYLGFLRNGSKNFVIIDKSADKPVLEMNNRRFPMHRTIDDVYFTPSLENMTVKLNGISGSLILR